MEKRSINFNPSQIGALNVPQHWEEFNLNSIIKSAALNEENKNGSFEDFDLKEAISKNPEHLFVKVFAIKENEMNDNGDFFSKEELQKAAKTFIGVPVFVNHQNDDIEKARGKVVHAWYDESKGGIYTINMVDKIAYPRLARGIETGVITGTSMGCSVQHSLCSVCHNHASTAKDFCSHIKERKKKKFSGECECEYHKNGNYDVCPLCGGKKGEKKKIKHKDQTIYEHNYGVKFIEDSFVVNPACHDCLVAEILNPDGLNKKVAELSESITKLASSVPVNEQSNICENGMCSLRKVAGISEINELNQAMNLMERVARSLMAQKERVSLEYVSDIVKTLADVQKISDELIEMGYAKLPSPSVHDASVGTSSAASPINKERIGQLSPSPATMQTVPQPTIQQSIQPKPSPQPSPSTVSPMETSYGDDVGRVVKPNISPKGANSREEFTKISENLINSLQAVYSNGNLIKNQITNMSDQILNNKIVQIDRDNLSVIISADGDGEIKIAECRDGKIMKLSDIDLFDSEMQDLIRGNSAKAAELIIESMIGNKQEIKESMENNENIKIAQSKDTTTENQLNGSDLKLHPRWKEGEHYTATTESSEQLGAKSPKSKDVSSDSPQVRKGTYSEITELQLANNKNGFLARWGDFPTVITEGQWTEMSREVFAKMPSDWTSYVQTGQLDSLRDSHSWKEPTVVTESQLRGSSKKTASSVNEMLKSASEAVVDSIVTYGLSGEQLKRVVAFVKSNPHNHLKASYMTLVNSAPWTVDMRQDVNAKNRFFKKASSSDMDPVDSFIGAMSDNIGSHRAEDFIDAVSFIVNDSSAWKIANDKAEERVASINSEDEISSKEDIFRKAFAENELPEDGMFKVCCTIKDDIGIDPSDNKNFLKAVFAFAQDSVSDRFGDIDIIPVNVDIDEENGLVECTAKQASMLDDSELEAWNKIASSLNEESPYSEDSDMVRTASSDDSNSRRARILDELDRLEKQAQLAGGQMPTALNPAGMGAGMQIPGAGAPAGAPPIESLTAGAPAGGAADPLAGLDMGMDDKKSDDEEEKAKPAAAVCVICGGNDVDVGGGKASCKGPGCGSNYTIKVVPDASLLDKIMDGDVDDSDTKPDSSSDVEKGLGGEGPAGPAPAMPPMAATAKLKVDTLNKIAKKIPFGSISPVTGGNNTMKVGGSTWKCLDSGQEYIVRVAADSKDPKSIWAQWEWIPEFKRVECSSCSRKKANFVNNLGKMGISESTFDSMNLNDKSSVILAMKEKGLLNETKVAFNSEDSKNVLGLFKAAFSTGNKFPMETCLEKLARRFGEDAVSMSGPCEGKNLADCVCSSLANEKMYSTGLANKIASIWVEKEAGSECIEDFVREGMTIKQASASCEQLRNKYISEEELLAEELTRVATGDMMVAEDAVAESDPFSSEMGSSMGSDMPSSGENDSGSVDLDIHMSDASLENLEKSLKEVLDALAPLTEGSDDGSKTEDVSEPVLEESEPVEDSMDSDEDDSVMDSIPEADGKEMMSEDKDAAMLKHAPESMVKEEGEYAMKESESLGESLKRGRIVGVNKINLDVSKLAQALSKSAGDKKVQLSNAQDQSEIGTISSGKALKSEHGEGFDAKGPKVPGGHGKALKSEHGEGFDDTAYPEVPVNGPALEGESEYKPEKGNMMTGGQNGSGSSSTGKHQMTRSAFEESLAKLAKEMSLSVNTVQEDPSIQPVKGKDSLAVDGFDPVENGGKPLSSEHGEGFDAETPSIPAGEGSMGHEKEMGLTPEKQEQITGGQLGAGSSTKKSNKPKTATASSSKESNESSKDAAIKLAGKMVESKIISANELPSKIAELERYEVSQIRDIEKAMFRQASVAQKGLVTASKGVERPLVIGETSSNRNGYTDLRSKISSLFSLQHQVDAAEETDNVQIRKTFK